MLLPSTLDVPPRKLQSSRHTCAFYTYTPHEDLTTQAGKRHHGVIILQTNQSTKALSQNSRLRVARVKTITTSHPHRRQTPAHYDAIYHPPTLRRKSHHPGEPGCFSHPRFISPNLFPFFCFWNRRIFFLICCGPPSRVPLPQPCARHISRNEGIPPTLEWFKLSRFGPRGFRLRSSGGNP